MNPTLTTYNLYAARIGNNGKARKIKSFYSLSDAEKFMGSMNAENILTMYVEIVRKEMRYYK